MPFSVEPEGFFASGGARSSRRQVGGSNPLVPIHASSPTVKDARGFGFERLNFHPLRVLSADLLGENESGGSIL